MDEDLITMDCPGCGRRLDTPVGTAGLEGRCPGCRTRFIIPGTPNPAHFPSIEREHSYQGGSVPAAQEASTTMKIDLDGPPRIPPQAPPRRFRIRRGTAP